MTDWTFHPTLVAPFYGSLMRANIAYYPPEKQEQVLSAFRILAMEVSDQQILEMLNSTWRPSIVAAWFIAYKQNPDYLPYLESILLARPGHVSHICICLARVSGTSTQSVLFSYLEGCANGSLQNSWIDESITPEWVICTLEYLYGSDIAKKTVAKWSEFLNYQHQNYELHEHTCIYSDMLTAWNVRLQYARTTFPIIMQLFDNGLHLT